MQSIGKKDYWRFGSLALLAVSLLGPTENVSAADQGPSSSQPPYIVKVPKGATPIKSILTVGDSVNNKPDGTPYRMVGIPDGMGAFDNGDGTFTLLMNHELTSDKGISRAHGAKGSFISKWIIKKGGLEVRSGEDLIQNISTWNANASTPSYNSPATGIALSRLCSADLPAQSAFYNQDTGLGTMERIFMNGEESGTEGRAFAHLMNGTSYELPRLGKFSWENSVASPGSGDTTVVVGMDDGQGGQVYVYVGTKTNSGSEIDKAGLTNGQLYGVKVDGYLAENTATVIPPATTFTLHNFGDVSGMTGQALETASGGNTTTFNRPEDGAWDPSNPNDFYFVTTASFTGNSRLWRLRFNDRSNPAAGGTIDMLLDGSEGQKMMDNMTITKDGKILIQEDPGNQPHIAKIWQYNIATDTMRLVAQHDPNRFTPGATNFVTQDEESSGIIDASDILGKNWFLLVVQAHSNGGVSDELVDELVEGGQLLVLHMPPGRD